MRPVVGMDVLEIGVAIGRDPLLRLFAPQHEVDGRMLVDDRAERRFLDVRDGDAEAGEGGRSAALANRH